MSQPLRTGLLKAALSRVGQTLSTPLLPEDYLSLVDPLWARTEQRARVVDVRREAAGATTLLLQPGPAWAGHTAGQWTRIGVVVGGVLHWRSYSLTAPPRPDGLISITAKPIPGGTVSHAVQDLQPGDVLRLAPADGDFTLPAELPDQLLFVTAGSGITPVMGMLRDLADRNALSDVVLLHSAATGAEVIFGDELRALTEVHAGFRLVERHTDTDGRLDVAEIAGIVPDWTDRTAYACGPAGLLDALEQHWTEHGAELRTERFTPRLVAAEGATGGSVTFARTGTVAAAGAGTALLEAGETAGVLLPSGCRMGICFSCVVPLLSGQVRDLRTGAVHGEPGDLVQTCVSACAGDVALDS